MLCIKDKVICAGWQSHSDGASQFFIFIFFCLGHFKVEGFGEPFTLPPPR